MIRTIAKFSTRIGDSTEEDIKIVPGKGTRDREVVQKSLFSLSSSPSNTVCLIYSQSYRIMGNL